MESITKKYYVCSICGKTGTDQDKIRACEESHITVIDCDVAEIYDKGKVIPNELRFSQGEKQLVYRFVREQ